MAALIALVVDVAIMIDFHLQPLRQGVDHRYADAVQPARDFVGPFIELASGVKFGQHHFDRRLTLGRMHVDGDATAIIQHSDAVVQMECDLDIFAKPG